MYVCVLSRFIHIFIHKADEPNKFFDIVDLNKDLMLYNRSSTNY